MDADDKASFATLVDYFKNLGEADSPDSAFRLAENAARELIGHQLFTVMRFRPATMQVRRCYSSNPRDYPAGGEKTKRNTAWGRQVLEQGRFFIGNSLDDIREHFTDHAVIEGLGLGSVLNMPIRNLGKTIGTMNLLDSAGSYRIGHVSTAAMIASGLAGVLLTEPR